MDNPCKHLSIISKAYAVLGWLLLVGSFFHGMRYLLAPWGSDDPQNVKIFLKTLVVLSSCSVMVLGLGLIFCGHAITKRKYYTCSVLFAALLCPCVPIGTIFGVYFLYVLLDTKTKRIFEAARACASSPHLPPIGPPSLPPPKRD